MQEKLAKNLSKSFKGVPIKNLKEAISRSKIIQADSFIKMIMPRGTTDYNYNRSIDCDNLLFRLPNFGQDAKIASFDDSSTTVIHNQGTRYSYPRHIMDYISIQGFEEVAWDNENIVNKHAFIKVLDHIKSQDPSYKNECNRMSKCYKELMSLCGNDVNVLNFVLKAPYSCNGASNYYSSYTIDKFKTKVEQVDYLATTIIHKIQTLGYSDEAIHQTVLRLHSSELENGVITLYDEQGTSQNTTIDLSSDTKFLDIVDKLGWTSNDLMRQMVNIRLKTNNTPKIVDFANNLNEDVYDKIHEVYNDMMQYKLYETSSRTQCALKPHEISVNDFSNYSHQIIGYNDETDGVLSNIVNLSQIDCFISSIANGYFANSKANKDGEDFSANCNYHTENMGWYKSNGYGSDRFSSLEEKHKVTQKQLDEMPVIPLQEYIEVRKEIDEKGKTGCNSYTSYYNDDHSRAASLSVECLGLDDTMSVGYKILQGQLDTAAKFLPQIKTTRVKTNEDVINYVHKNLGITQLWTPNTETDPVKKSAQKLLHLRENLFNKANCSIRTMSKSEQETLLHQVKMDFDYVDDNGKRVSIDKRAYADRTLVFHGNTYEINNSNNQEALKKEAKKLNETPQLMYHGTSYSAATSIVGVEGKFRVTGLDATSRSGDMLGKGIYSAKLVGKTLPYIGNNPYSYSSYNQKDEYSPDDYCDGILLVCEGVLGKTYHSTTSTYDAKAHNDGTYDSISVGAGASMGGMSTLKEFERVVTRRSMISPKYLVDCGARKYDRSIR